MGNSNTNIVISAEDKTRQAFEAVNGRLGKLNSSLGTLTNVGGAAGAAVAGTIGYFVTSTRSFANYADEIGKAAQKVGSTTEKLSELKYAGDLADVTFEQLQTGLGKLAKTAEDFKDGSTSAVAAFAKLKIDPSKFKDTGELFTVVADKLSKMEDGARKTAIAQELLGKSGKELIPLLNEGAAGLAKYADEAKKLGLVIDRDTAKAAEEFNDNLTRLESASGLLGRTVGKELVPSLAKTAELLTEDVKQGNLLTATFRVLAGLGKLPFDLLFPLPDPSAAGAIKELRDEITQLQSTIDASKRATRSDIVDPELAQKLAVAKTQLARYLKFRDKLTKPAENKKTSEDEAQTFDELAKSLSLASVKFAELNNKQAEATQSFKAGVITLEQYQEITKAIQKQRDDLNKSAPAKHDKDAEAAANFIEKLQKEADTLDLAKPKILEYDAAHLKLSDSQKITAHNLIGTIKAYEDLAASTKAWAEQEALLLDFNQREIDQNDELQASEDALLQQREEAFASLNETLLTENENLNIGLITSDKKRARAQLDLEHQRALDRINSLVLEGEETQQLVDEETANYELRLKQLDNTKDAAKELGLTFTSAFEEAVVGGKELSEVLKSLLDDVAKFFLRKGVTDPLLNGLDGFDISSVLGSAPQGSAGSGDGVLGWLHSLLPSFAVGTDYVPHDMIAQIHKGERIVPAAQNNGFGGNVSVSVSVDAGGSSVQGNGAQASELGRVIGAAVQAELLKQKRPGGILA